MTQEKPDMEIKGKCQGDVSEFPGKSNNWAFDPYLKFKF
jgi:hypothetical protein